MGLGKRQDLRLMAGAIALVIALTGCSSNDGGVATTTYGSIASSPPAAPITIAGGDWSVPAKVGIGGYTLVTDADAVEILNDQNASPAYTYYVRDKALLEFSKDGQPTAAEMLDFRFNSQLLRFYQAMADEQRSTSSPEVQELNPTGVALYRKIDNSSTVEVQRITGPNVGQATEMCANSGTGGSKELGVCRVVRDGNIYLFAVRGQLDETEGKMWVNEFLIAQGLTGLTQ